MIMRRVLAVALVPFAAAMGRLDPRTGMMSEVDTVRGSLPRRVAADREGMLWITYYGNGKAREARPARDEDRENVSASRR